MPPPGGSIEPDEPVAPRVGRRQDRGITVDVLHDDKTGTVPHLEAVPDLVLLDRARSGHRDAFAELYRRHRPAALRVARRLGARQDVEDVVAETFAQVLRQVSLGGGPHSAVRSYVLTAVRHEVGRRLEQRARTRPTDELEVLDGTTTLHGGRPDGSETQLVRTALSGLPERWRLVLWRVEVEGRRPREVADELGLRPNAVAALAYRARKALRQAYVDAHVTVPTSLPPACRSTRPRLGLLVRGGLDERQRAVVERHVARCGGCADVRAELGVVVRGIPTASGATGVLRARSA